ncbi:MAG: hypothetical protein ACRD29_08150 [Acidimicrobiales bacterium]
MNLREYDPARDGARLAGFRCSVGDAVHWVTDAPRANFQRRVLGVNEEGEDLVAVVAWQDIVRVDLGGIWLEVLAVSLDHQHAGKGAVAYDLTVDHLRTVDRDGDHLAGLVHADNDRSKRLLGSREWTFVSQWGEHELWVGLL